MLAVGLVELTGVSTGEGEERLRALGQGAQLLRAAGLASVGGARLVGGEGTQVVRGPGRPPYFCQDGKAS